jgi:hypothetical protein
LDRQLNILIKAVRGDDEKRTVRNVYVQRTLSQKCWWNSINRLLKNFVIFSFSLSHCGVLRWIRKIQLGCVETVGNLASSWRLKYANIAQVSWLACKLENHKLKLAAFIYCDVEVLSYQYDTAQKCVKELQHEVQSAKPTLHRQ